MQTIHVTNGHPEHDMFVSWRASAHQLHFVNKLFTPFPSTDAHLCLFACLLVLTIRAVSCVSSIKHAI